MLLFPALSLSIEHVFDLRKRLEAIREKENTLKKEEPAQNEFLEKTANPLSLRYQEPDKTWKRVKLDSVSYSGNFEMSGLEYRLIPKLYMNPKVDIELVSTPENKEVLPIKIANLQNVLWKIRNKYGMNLYRYSRYNGITALNKEHHQEFEDKLRRKIEKLQLIRKQKKEQKFEEISTLKSNLSEADLKQTTKSYAGIFKVIKNK